MRSFLLAKAIAGNDYHEAIGATPSAVLVTYLRYASSSIGPLAPPAGTVDVDAVHRLVLCIAFEVSKLRAGGKPYPYPDRASGVALCTMTYVATSPTT